MRKRSKKLQDIVDHCNELLALEVVDAVEVGNGTLQDKVPSSDIRVQCWKQGICDMLHYLLHKDKQYRGFMYTGNVSVLYDRKYF